MIKETHVFYRAKDGDFDTRPYEMMGVGICEDGLLEYFAIPSRINKIWVVLSDKPMSNSYLCRVSSQRSERSDKTLTFLEVLEKISIFNQLYNILVSFPSKKFYFKVYY